jgi:site-specific DNA-methyltransferase (adenine-specific)
MSNPKWFKYCWYWKKSKPNGWQHSKNKPMTAIEECAVFSSAPMGHASLLADKRMKYYPQGVKQEKVRKVTATAHGRSMGARLNQVGKEYQAFTGFPHNVLTFGNMTGSQASHPTEKPVTLIEYLIKTYTQESELILDNTAGSGTLAIAAINTNRQYICIEKDEHYFDVMRNRIENHDPFAPIKTKKPKAVPKGQLTLFDGGIAS